MTMNNYADDILKNIAEDGMTPDLWQLANEDISLIKKLNIKNDNERNLFFYLENFIDDVLEEFQYDGHDKESILYKVFNILRKKDNIGLNDIRLTFLNVLNSLYMKKNAYPNTIGIREENSKLQRDIEKWIKSLGELNLKMRSGKDKYNAIEEITEGWSNMEKNDFVSWLKYYEHGDHEKYKTASLLDDINNNNTLKEETVEVPQYYGSRLGRPPKTTKTKEDFKQSLISRLDSAGKLLREFSNVWPRDIWNRLSQALSDLKREIVPLKAEATMLDCIVRTANIWDKNGFSEGADFLKKIAQPPTDDVTSQIEKALTGKEYEKKPKKETSSEMFPFSEGNIGGEIGQDQGMGQDQSMGQEGQDQGMGISPVIPGSEENMEELPPSGAGEELPPPIELPEKKESNKNLFDGKNVQDAINILEPISKQLSERRMVREITKVDMILDSLDMASFFPEIGEATSKMIEASIYVNNRIEKVISKLKGSLKNKEKEAPIIEVDELSDLGKSIEQPEMGQPEMGQPEMGQPEMGQPEMGQPEMGQPEMGQPEMGQPEMGQQKSPKKNETEMFEVKE